MVREWTVDNAPAVDSLTYRRSECGKPGSALSFSKSQPQGVKLLSVLHCLRMQLVDFINMLVFVTVLCVCVCGTGYYNNYYLENKSIFNFNVRLRIH